VTPTSDRWLRSVRLTDPEGREVWP